VTDDEFAYHRDQVDVVLRSARARLSDSEQDRVREAVKLRRGDWSSQVGHGTAERELAERLVALLESADRELLAEHVRQLEERIGEELAQ
jgi:hypothetical protein